MSELTARMSSTTGEILTHEAWANPRQVRDLRAMRDVSPGAPAAEAPAVPRCNAGVARCFFGPDHIHVEGAVWSPACSGCGALAGPFDARTGRCPRCLPEIEA